MKTPSEFTEAGRVLYAARALERDGRSLDELQRHMGIYTQQTLRDEICRVLGLSMSELRKEGAFQMVSRRLNDEFFQPVAQ